MAAYQASSHVYLHAPFAFSCRAPCSAYCIIRVKPVFKNPMDLLDQLSRQEKAQFDIQFRHRINAARVAVKAQIPFFDRHFGAVASEWKADKSRVTFADLALSSQLTEALAADFKTDLILSEESSIEGQPISVDTEFSWLLDPIDGTNNFALGFSVCAISVALMYRGYPIYGFIYDHSSRSLIEGGYGYGLLIDQKKCQRSHLAEQAQRIIGMHYPMAPDVVAQYQSLLSRYRVRCLGSGTLTLLYVAMGPYCGIIDYGVKHWDIAAAYAICEAVGIDFRFIQQAPFPLKRFHTDAQSCAYYAGDAAFMAEVEALQ